MVNSIDINKLLNSHYIESKLWEIKLKHKLKV